MKATNFRDFFGDPPNKKRLEALLELLEIAVSRAPGGHLALLVVQATDTGAPKGALAFGVGPAAQWLQDPVIQATSRQPSGLPRIQLNPN